MRELRAVLLLPALAVLLSPACARRAGPEHPAEAQRPLLDANAAQLSVQVLEKSTRTPLAGVRVVLVSSADEANDGADDETAERVDGSSGNLHQAPITGRDGKVLFEIPPALDLELLACVAGGPRPESRAVGFLRPGERREVVLELRRKDEVHVVGQVLRAGSTRPIAGARVQLIEARLDDSGSPSGPWVREALAQTATSADGRFELSVSTWRSPHLRVEADGYGLRLGDPSGNHEDIEHALLVELAPAGSLDVQMLGSSGGTIAGASIVVEAEGTSLARCSSSRPMLPPESWRLETGLDGHARFSGLPAGVGLQVEARRHEDVLHRAGAELRLDPGEAKELEWRIDMPPQLRGIVLDQDEQPVRGQEIWLAPSSAESNRYFDLFDRSKVVARDRTDGEGRFALDGVQPGRWRIGPAPSRDESGIVEASAVAPIPVLVRTKDTPPRDLTLRVYRGIYLCGKVLSPDGAPVADAPVSAESKLVRSWRHARTSKEGTFALGPLEPGAVTLRADRAGPFARAEPLQAKAGDSGLVLRLRPGGGLRLHAIDARTRSQHEAKLLISPLPRGSGPIGIGTMMTGTDPDGSRNEDGLDPGRYGIAAWTTDGKFAVCGGIEVVAGAPPSDVELALQPGGTVRVSYAGPRNYVTVVITSAGIPLGFPEPLHKGETRDLLVPAGASVLELWWQRSDSPQLEPVELEPGETRELSIKEKD